MQSELVLQKPSEAAVVPQTLLDVIYATVTNPDVDVQKIAVLMQMQERMEDREAEKQFNAAFAAVQMELPNIVKDGRIKMVKDGVDKGTLPFATFENVMSTVGPKLRDHAFSYSFTSEETAAGVLITLTVRHSAGHSKTSTMRLPADPGPGRNNIQAIGSSWSYAKRYLMLGMLAIVCVGEDDDGNKGANMPITKAQEEKIISLLIDNNITEREFLTMAKRNSISEIPANRYDAAVNAIKAKGLTKK